MLDSYAEDSKMADLPIACTLTDDALRTRKQGLLGRVANQATSISRIPSGYRLEFAADLDTLSLVVSMIEAERQCCRFLRFSLSVEPNLGPIALELTGPGGTQEFLDALLDPA